MTVELIDPIQLVTEILEQNGYDQVHSELLTSDAMSAECYIWLTEQPGSTPHVHYSNRPAIGVTVYSKSGYGASRRHSYDIQALLADSISVKYPSGGIHSMITDIHPYRQDIAGTPFGVGRTYAQYSLILSDFSHWS